MMADLDVIRAGNHFSPTRSPAKVPRVILSIIELDKRVQITDICCCFFCRMSRTICNHDN